MNFLLVLGISITVGCKYGLTTAILSFLISVLVLRIVIGAINASLRK